MTWLYDETELPTSSTNGLVSATTEQKKNFIRYLIGDVNTSRQLTSDEGIYACMATEANIYMAAARSLLAIIQNVLAGGIEDQKVGETRIRIKRGEELKLLANDLRDRGASYKLPSAGGILLADRESAEDNTSLLQPSITLGMHDIPTGLSQAGGKKDTGGDEIN